ncbi:MAG: hypothetical protein Q8O68_00050 [Candidatus Daviesbacteria bacterium]|nr:hypothetical protein [Candidatus Daviesbacteria bacterium]
MELVSYQLGLGQCDFSGSGSLLASGGDSDVYRLGYDRVIKFYHRLGHPLRPPQELVRLFAETTNRAAQCLEENSLDGQVSLAGEDYTYRFSVNPVLEIGLDSLDDGPFLISKFIAGLSLQDLVGRDYSKVGLEKKVSHIEEKKEKKFFHDILKLMYGHKGWFSKKGAFRVMQEDGRILYELSTFLEDQLGVVGIDVIDENVKVRRPQSGQLSIIVTDLCTGFAGSGLIAS